MSLFLAYKQYFVIVIVIHLFTGQQNMCTPFQFAAEKNTSLTINFRTLRSSAVDLPEKILSVQNATNGGPQGAADCWRARSGSAVSHCLIVSPIYMPRTAYRFYPAAVSDIVLIVPTRVDE